MIKQEHNHVILEFGTGDIGLNAGSITKDNENIGIIVFYNQEPREIGSPGDIKAGTEVDLNSFPVLMEFSKKESVDVIIKALQEVKQSMSQETSGGESMKRYRKKPVIIEAVQFTGTEDNLSLLRDFIDRDITVFRKSFPHGQITNIEIETLEGDHIANIGDYIIKGVKGEHYPCKPDIFEMTYEKVE